MPPVLWAPDEARVERATLTRYARWLAGHGVETDGYHELWRWSVDDVEAFWASIWEFFDVRASSPYERVLASRAMPGADWFPGARLNFAEHVFRGRDPGAVAVRHASELRPLARDDLGGPRGRRPAASPARSARRESGRAIGSSRTCRTSSRRWPRFSRVRASARSGRAARRTSARESVVDRFAQIEPRVLFTVDGYRYGGRDHDRLDVVRQLQEAMPTLERTVVLGYLNPKPSLDGLRDATGWDGVPRGRRRRPARVRAGRLRRRALGALQLGHDRAPEGDRARARRDPPRVAEAAEPPRRPAAATIGCSGSRRPAG